MTIAKSDAASATRNQFESDLNQYTATASASARASGKNGTEKSWLAFGAATSAALLSGASVEASIVHVTINAMVSGNNAVTVSIGAGSNFRFEAESTTLFNAFRVLAPTGGEIAVPNGGPVANSTSALPFFQEQPFGLPVGTGNSQLVGTDGVGTVAAAIFSNTGFVTGTGTAMTTVFSPYGGFESGIIGISTVAGHLGWIRVSVTGGSTSSPVLEIVDAAFDNMGGHPDAGVVPDPTGNPVPEPSTTVLAGLGMLAMGAAGVRRHRRRKATERATTA